MIERLVLKVFRPWNPTQSFLLPPSPLEWLPEGHLALVVLDFFDAADLSAIEDAIDRKDPRGNPPAATQRASSTLVDLLRHAEPI